MCTIEDYIFTNWERLFGVEKKPDRINLMKIGGRPGNKSSVPFLIFINRDKFPSYFLKVNRDSAYPQGIEEEYNNYCEIQRRLSDEMKKTVPCPVFLEKIEYYTMFCETAIYGRKFGKQIFNNRNQRFKEKMTARFFNLSVQWLNNFHKETFSGFVDIDDDFVAKYGIFPLENLLNIYPDETQNLKGEVEDLISRLKRFRDVKIPIVSVHGDFDFWNILIKNDTINVVDWEECQAKGLPFNDLFYFLFHFAFVFEEEWNAKKSFDSFFRKGSWSQILAKNLLEEFSKHLNLPPELILTMAPLYCIELLLKKYSLHRDPKSIPLNSFEALRLTLGFSQSKIF